MYSDNEWAEIIKTVQQGLKNSTPIETLLHRFLPNSSDASSAVDLISTEIDAYVLSNSVAFGEFVQKAIASILQKTNRKELDCWMFSLCEIPDRDFNIQQVISLVGCELNNKDDKRMTLSLDESLNKDFRVATYMKNDEEVYFQIDSLFAGLVSQIEELSVHNSIPGYLILVSYFINRVISIHRIDFYGMPLYVQITGGDGMQLL